MKRIKNTCYLSSCIALATLTQNIQAQNDADIFVENFSSAMILEEIVVTARKKQEALQDTPVAISAYSSGRLKKDNINSLVDLQQSTPGLNFSSQGSKNPSIFIRGIGQRESLTALDPGVGVYINNIYIPRTDSQMFDTLDFQSIQVLRGPQGTLFGKNNTGGAILIETKKPTTEQFEGELSVKTGNYNRQNATLGMNIPLSDTLAMRTAISSVRRDGYMENVVNGGNYGEEDRLSASARILWQASDDISLDTFAYWSKQSEKGVPFTCIPVNNPTAQFTPFIFPGYASTSFSESCAESLELSKDNQFANNSSLFQLETSLLAFTLNWDIGELNLRSVTSIGQQKDIIIEDDIDATALPGLSNGHLSLQQVINAHNRDSRNTTKFEIDPEERQQLSQEFQLQGKALNDKLEYTVGIYLSSEEITDSVFTQVVGRNGYTLIDSLPIIGSHGLVAKVLGTTSDLNNDTAALFAQADYHFAKELTVTAGLRYTIEKRERSATLYNANQELIAEREGLGAYLPAFGVHFVTDETQFEAFKAGSIGTIPMQITGTETAQHTWKKLTPTVTVAYTIPEPLLVNTIDNTMLYITSSKGFKAGGFEPKGEALSRFEPEEVTNLEFGWKLDALDHKLRFNGAVFSMDYKNMQQRVATKGEGAADVFVYIDNAGQSSLQGIELELSALLADKLSLTTSMSYLDASYDEFISEEVVPNLVGFPEKVLLDRSDNEVGSIPPLNYSLSLRYEMNGPAGTFIPNISMSYRDEMFVGIDYDSAKHAETTLDDFTLFNAHMRYIPNGWDEFEITLFVDNITDEDYFDGGFATTSNIPATIASKGAPRTYGMGLNYYF